MPSLFGQVLSNSYRASYGTMFKLDDSDIVTIASSGVYQDIEGLSPGTLRGWTFNLGKELACVEAGIYLILWHTVVQCLSNKKDLHVAVKNATSVFPTTRSICSADKDMIMTMSGFGVGPANVGEVARLGITSVPAGDFVVKDAKLTLIRLDS